MPTYKKVSADEARTKNEKVVRKSGGGLEVVVKGFKSPPSWNQEQRSARFTMTSESVDRYGDIVVQGGLDITRFMENPQGLLFHNSRTWPAGKWSDITKLMNGRPKRTEGTFNFLPEGTDEDADRAARHVAAGSIRTVSIGFRPDWDDVEMILDDEGEYVTGWKFNKSELLECSLVPIPAQPDALVKDAGGDWAMARDLIEDVLDSYIKTPDGLLLPLDVYRAQHLDLVGERTFHVVRALVREPKTIKVEDAHLTATTDAEAAAYVGMRVLWDPSHVENKESPASDVFADCTGEIIASYIVDSGEFEGVHGLAVEWTNKEGTAVGMYRGLKAERVLLAQAPATPAAKMLLSAEQVDEFLADAVSGDTVSRGEEHESMVTFVLSREGKAIKWLKHQFSSIGADPVTDADKDKTVADIAAKIASISVEAPTAPPAPDAAENKTETDEWAKPIVVEIKADTSEVEAAVEKVDGLLSRLFKRFPGFFAKAPEVERTEPTIVPPAPPEPPSAEAIAAATARASAIRERLSSKGLIQA